MGPPRPLLQESAPALLLLLPGRKSFELLPRPTLRRKCRRLLVVEATAAAAAIRKPMLPRPLLGPRRRRRGQRWCDRRFESDLERTAFKQHASLLAGGCSYLFAE